MSSDPGAVGDSEPIISAGGPRTPPIAGTNAHTGVGLTRKQAADLGFNPNGIKKTKTEAPTNAATVKNVEKATSAPASMTEAEFDFVVLMDMHYGLHGEFPSADKALEDYKIPVKQYNKFVETPIVLTALSERNVKLPNVEVNDDGTPSWRNHSLSALQLLVANTMLDLVDTRSDKKKLQDLGVPTSKYQAWLSDPVFSGYLRDRAERLLGVSQHEASLALQDKIRQGDIKAIEFYMELTGRFTRQRAGLQDAGRTIQDLNNLMVQMVEIITEEIEDLNVARRIGDRFKQLIGARQMVSELTGIDSGIITPPEIAAARVITPDLQKLMDSGAGYDD